MLEQIYERPDDDELRLVYADWLQERGDPRGELIALQYQELRGRGLTSVEDARVEALIKAGSAAWLGALDGKLDKDIDPVWERGFLAECWFPKDGEWEGVAPLVGHPAWSTVRQIYFLGMDPDPPQVPSLVLHRAMRSLRVLKGLTLRMLAPICTAAAPPPLLETVSVLCPDEFTDDQKGVVLSCAALPRLRRLALQDPDHRWSPSRLTWFSDSPLVAGLEEILVSSDAANLAAWCAEAARLERRWRASLLEIDTTYGYVRLRRAAATGSFTELQVHAQLASHADAVAAMVEAAPPHLTALRVSALPKALAELDLTRLERAAARLRHLTLLELPAR